MLNGRLYRAAFVPFLFALALAAFSLSARPGAPSSTLTPEAFDGATAFSELNSLAAQYPARRPGSRGDDRLAAHVAQQLEALGGTAGGGFSVHTYTSEGQTIAGERSLLTVIAQRPGSTSASPILILAHRDAAGAGGSSSEAELSGTAALMELARVFATRATKRTIVLASTSSGSGGDAAAAALVSDPGAFGLHGPFDAALVLGDLAGVRTRRPFVVPYSDGLGSAPLQLQETVSQAISQQVGADPGSPSALGQLVHLVFPIAVGEQGVLNARGLPAVQVQVSGERGPRPSEPVSMERLEGFGRGALSAVDALDTSPDIPTTMQTGLLLRHKTLPMWALRLLAITLLFPAFVAAVDGFARARRRRARVGRSMLWTLSCALPFLTCALFAYVLGWLGILPARPPVPALESALPFDGEAAATVVAVALTFALAWLLWRWLVRRVGWGVRPDPSVCGLSLVLILIAIAFVSWIGNPFTALLALPAVHLWLVLAAPELRPRRLIALALVALGMIPLALVIAFYADELGLRAGGVAWMAVLLLAGGHVGLGSAVLWSAAFGCAAAAVMLAVLAPAAVQQGRGQPIEEIEITIRGPMSYAGPGSLGGTESALRL